jgi:hypothetical protein
VVGNANPARAEGKCHRKDTACETSERGRVETSGRNVLMFRCSDVFVGKGEMVR